MSQGEGVGASADADLATAVEPVPVSPLRDGIPSADRNADEALKLGELYREVQSREWACSEIVCVYPHDGNCCCFNTALALYVAQSRDGECAHTAEPQP